MSFREAYIAGIVLLLSSTLAARSRQALSTSVTVHPGLAQGPARRLARARAARPGG